MTPRDYSFIVGDKVIIDEYVKGESYRAGYMVGMRRYAGSTGIVTRVTGSGAVELDVDNGEWYWSRDMLTLIKKVKRKKVVILPPSANLNLTLKQIAAYKRILKMT